MKWTVIRSKVEHLERELNALEARSLTVHSVTPSLPRVGAGGQVESQFWVIIANRPGRGS